MWIPNLTPWQKKRVHFLNKWSSGIRIAQSYEIKNAFELIRIAKDRTLKNIVMCSLLFIMVVKFSYFRTFSDRFSPSTFRRKNTWSAKFAGKIGSKWGGNWSLFSGYRTFPHITTSKLQECGKRQYCTPCYVIEKSQKALYFFVFLHNKWECTQCFLNIIFYHFLILFPIFVPLTLIHAFCILWVSSMQA